MGSRSMVDKDIYKEIEVTVNSVKRKINILLENYKLTSEGKRETLMGLPIVEVEDVLRKEEES